MKYIPNDDIMDYYMKAPENIKRAVSDLLETENIESYIALQSDKEHVVTSSMYCSAVTSQVMLISLFRSLTEDYGRIWLNQFLVILGRELKI